MARSNKNQTSIDIQNYAVLGPQIEADIQATLKSARKLYKFKKLMSLAQGVGIVAVIFTPLTFINLVIGWVATEIAEGIAERSHESLKEKTAKSFTLIQDLIKDKKSYTDTFEYLFHYSSRKNALEQIIRQIVGSKSDKELKKIGIDKTNFLSPAFRQHTLNTFFGESLAEKIEKYDKESVKNLNKFIENEAKNIQKETLGETNTGLQAQIHLLHTMVNMSHLTFENQINYLSHESENQTPGAQKLLSRLAINLASVNISAIDMYSKNMLSANQVVALVSHNYKLTSCDIQALKDMVKEREENLSPKDIENILPHRSLMASLAKNFYEASLAQGHATQELELAAKYLGNHLPQKIKTGILEHFPEIYINSPLTASHLTLNDKMALSKHTNAHSSSFAQAQNAEAAVDYEGMAFEFKNPGAQTTWTQLIENMRVLDSLIHNESNELSIEAKFNIQNIKTSTLPSLFKIYESTQTLPEGAKINITKEIEATLSNMLDITQSIIEENAQQHLLVAQGLRNYSEKKKMSLGK